MFTLQHIADADSVDWDALYPRAVATSCDWVLERSAERVAACDELLALTPGELPSLGILAMFTQLAPVADGYAHALARETGALLRLLDRALAAHGRDHGYEVEAWREHAREAAWVSASLLGPLEPDTYPLMLAARRAAERIGLAQAALPRDRLAVPERLADAIGPLLALYAATCDAAP